MPVDDPPDRRTAETPSQKDDLRSIQSGIEDMQAGRSMSIEESERRVDDALAEITKLRNDS